MRRFRLVRYQDASGVSGTGVVAEGVEFSSGQAALQWLRSARAERPGATSLYHGVEDVIAVHGHGGKTALIWLD